ncbi:hypothetical protein SAMN02927921_03663 [Sinomicrobium oceani]|uniref:Uncharacterized protein n=1 Tax=Sinomicrobium oceani TaxID=1150368 RepID=A0A1K1RKE0_9FLAO|nr:hypothetical protein SAMN02927921_03663 [Sinomicrobium oceani]
MCFEIKNEGSQGIKKRSVPGSLFLFFQLSNTYNKHQIIRDTYLLTSEYSLIMLSTISDTGLIS